jgi:plastocyanin
MQTRILVTGLAAAAALAAAGCGGSDNSTSTAGGSTTTSTTTASTQTITISEKDYSLDPSTVTVDTAGTVTFKAVNDGGTDHALEIEGNGGGDQRTDTIGAGESATVTLDLKPGTYTMYCPIGGHRALGMEGTITVNG